MDFVKLEYVVLFCLEVQHLYNSYYEVTMTTEVGIHHYNTLDVSQIAQKSYVRLKVRAQTSCYTTRTLITKCELDIEGPRGFPTGVQRSRFSAAWLGRVRTARRCHSHEVPPPACTWSFLHGSACCYDYHPSAGRSKVRRTYRSRKHSFSQSGWGLNTDETKTFELYSTQCSA